MKRSKAQQAIYRAHGPHYFEALKAMALESLIQLWTDARSRSGAPHRIRSVMWARTPKMARASTATLFAVPTLAFVCERNFATDLSFETAKL
jgi:hypothetical protein